VISQYCVAAFLSLWAIILWVKWFKNEERSPDDSETPTIVAGVAFMTFAGALFTTGLLQFWGW
jgi:hypothetical protein